MSYNEDSKNFNEKEMYSKIESENITHMNDNNLNEEEINLNEEIMKMRIKLEQLRQKKKN